MDKLARNIIKYRWLTIGTVVILTLFLGFQIKNLRLNPDVISSLPDTDPDAALIKQISEEFTVNNMGMVIIETEDIFTKEVLEHVRTLTDTLTLTPGVASVMSLTNVTEIRGDGEGIQIGKLMDEYDLPDTPSELADLKSRVYEKGTYTGNIISEDGSSTVIIFTLAKDSDTKTVAREIKQKTKALNFPEKIYFGGSPMMVTYISDIMIADLKRLIPIAFALIVLILFLGFRSARGVILPLLTTIIAIVWTMGIMALGGFEMSMISSDIPIILLAVGTAYTIHVVNKINQVREKNWKKATLRALKYIIVPVFLAALTTEIGFLSFLIGSYLHMIRDFGIFTALGTFFAFLLSIFFVPAIVSMLPNSMKTTFTLDDRIKKSYLSDNYLAPLHRLLFKHPKYILASWGILLLISLLGTFFIQRSVDIKDYFQKKNPARLAEEIMVEKFGGSKPIFVAFEGNMQDPEVLKTMIRTEEFMKESPYVTSTQSIADLIAQLSFAMGNDRSIPDDQAQIEQLWFLLEGNELIRQFVTDDLTRGIIISKFTASDIKEKKAFGDKMESFIKANETPDCKIQVTGMPFVDVMLDKSLIRSQFRSVTVAIIFVIIILSLILKSFLNGLFASIPIMATILLLFGIMGIAGIPMNIATVLVASVALGIGIDYSIHVISYFNAELKQHHDIRQALDNTIMVSGKAILINVMSVAAGFLVLIFSEFVPLQYFGLLMAISMLGSSQGAMTLLPVILILVNRKKEASIKNKLNERNQ
ncbi:MAG TPA: efflux RND transporter permease subunit [Bacteroidales bacterium]|nr:efflux RND transporter permease subunit [Bacteroidales bacterium]HNS46379.1 efflux RND transporter permease subunit [Bacteroidales bacterium]